MALAVEFGIVVATEAAEELESQPGHEIEAGWASAAAVLIPGLREIGWAQARLMERLVADEAVVVRGS